MVVPARHRRKRATSSGEVGDADRFPAVEEIWVPRVGLGPS
jgi:hypothetical protein